MTSHGPELLDDAQISANSIIAVDAEGEVTRLARPDPAAIAVLRGSQRIRAACGTAAVEILVVVAVREYESIFLAGLKSLHAEGKLAIPPDQPADPEDIRGAKERLSFAVDAPCYQETTHQARKVLCG
ncbi:MAG TPA: hypothetical protein VFX70_08445 [Mycobacteriales bacterium]|nr:hypothetical protein [Mycobacteriales bacterium]